jgi:hypothetical protein
VQDDFKIAPAILARGKNFFRGPAQYGFPWHSEDDATCFVLGDCERIRLLHFEQAIGAIIAHASHQDTCRTAPSSLCHGSEQHINTGTVTGHQRSLSYLQKITGAEATDERMPISRSDKRAAGTDLVQVGGLNFNAAKAYQPS